MDKVDEHNGRSFPWRGFLLVVVAFSLVELGITAAASTDENEVAMMEMIGKSLYVNEKAWPSGKDPCADNWQGVTCGDLVGNILHVQAIQLQNSSLNGILALPHFANLTFLKTLDLSNNNIQMTVTNAFHFPATLVHLDLSNNNLTGQLEPVISALPTDITFLSLSNNNFQGQIPALLGSFVSLQIVSIHSNPGVSGQIPAQLGYLKSCRELYLNGNSLKGPIPTQLGKLVNLTHLHLHYNQLSGTLPSGLGSLGQLQSLQLQGNSLSGPLPGGVIQGLSQLQRLYAHSNKFTGYLPQSFSDIQQIVDIDLSFNNFNGSILQAFGHLPNLNRLLLSYNSLSGSIPYNLGSLSKASTLDLSHNALSGPIPSSLSSFGSDSSTPIQMDLTFNYLQLDSSPNSFSSSSVIFNCANGSAPSCLRSGIGDNTSFAVNSGGGQLTTQVGQGAQQINLTYDSDNSYSYPVGGYISPGWFMETTGLQGGLIQTNENIAGTPNPELYQNARVSSDSISYVGLALGPGHYNVTFHFAEIVLDGVGDRVFDIIIQNATVFPNFDIVKQAGGSFRACNLSFDVFLMHGPLSVQLYSGNTQVQLPNGNTNGPLISAIYAVKVDNRTHPPRPNSPPSPPPPGLPAVPRNSGTPIIWAAVGGSAGGIAFVGLCLAIGFLLRRKKQQPRLGSFKAMGIGMGKQSGSGEIGPIFFTYSELKTATNNFSPTSCLGEGGFGAVFKGKLPNGRLVAVKQLSKGSKGTSKLTGIDSMRNEVIIISNLRQRNLLTLLGCCMEGECPMLVCDYMPRGSLDRWLRSTFVEGSSEVPTLDWARRFKIALGVGRGLTYLHEDSPHRIIHRDVKPANILLDDDWNPQLADFGLARLFGQNETLVITSIMGTRGYVAPEYALQGQLSDKVDVYSFGVVLLELVSGRQVLDRSLPPERVLLVDWTWDLLETGLLSDLVDPMLHGVYDEEEVLRTVYVALWCTQHSPELRPAISQALLMLTGKVPIPPLPKRRNLNASGIINPFEGEEWRSWTSQTKESLSTRTDENGTRAIMGR